MSGADIPAPDIVAFLGEVKRDLENPRYFDHPRLGRLRLLPMPAPLPSLWYGHATPFDSSTVAQIVLETADGGQPSLLQEASAAALLRGWKGVYLPKAADFLDEVSERLAAKRLAPRFGYDPARVSIVQIRVPLDPLRGPLRVTLNDERAQRYNIILTWLGGRPCLVDVEDRFLPGYTVMDGAPILVG